MEDAAVALLEHSVRIELQHPPFGMTKQLLDSELRLLGTSFGSHTDTSRPPHPTVPTMRIKGAEEYVRKLPSRDLTNEAHEYRDHANGANP